jgi:putative lipoic acid-binding regulatory protein
MAEGTNFENLRARLEKLSWPMVYMFKFIVPAKNKQIAQVEGLFSSEAEISQKESSEGNYISITARVVMLSADNVVEVYEKASRIEGLMAL